MLCLVTAIVLSIIFVFTESSRCGVLYEFAGSIAERHYS